tara:strand:+ start:9785 stop:10354 length:570 start_codon:yes stop_codon:yes gene_type:complete
MWKEILKIDMGEAHKLGDKYAPEDMKEVDNLEGKRREFRDKKKEVFGEYSDFVLEHMMPDIYRLELNYKDTLTTNFGGKNITDNIFGKIYNKASKETQTFYTKNLINEENYKTYDVDKKMNELRQALEKYKNIHKEKISEFAEKELEKFKQSHEYITVKRGGFGYRQEKMEKIVEEAEANLKDKGLLRN